MLNRLAGGHCLWPILACLALLTVAPVGLQAAGVCHQPPDPNVAYPMYNRLLTIRLPIRQDAATRDWVAMATRSGPDGLTVAGLHEIRHLLASVFPGKLWVHDATSAWLESNGTRLALQDLIVELNSPADSDHCSHVFQQHLFMAAETHATDTHFDLRQFSDIQVEYRHVFGACLPSKEETVHFYGALRLDKADPECRGLASAKDAAAISAGLATDLHRLADRLYFLPSSRFNSTGASAATGNNDTAPFPILLQSNSRLLAFIADFRLRVDSPTEDWPNLGADIADRYARLSRHSDDYGVPRQGAGPSCLNYMNFASPPTAQLATSCRACYDIAVPVSANVSLSESADIRPPQCETIASVRADASRRVIETRDILASLARSNITAHLFLPSSDSAYIDIRSVSCSAQPKRLVAELTVRLRLRHPALLRYPLVLQAGLQRNINDYLVQRHLGLASVRLSGPVSANSADCGSSAQSSADSSLDEAVAKLCRKASQPERFSILRHRFQFSLGRQSLLSQVPSTRPDLTVGLVRFFLTAALSHMNGKTVLNGSDALLSLTVARRNSSGSSNDAAIIDADASYYAAAVDSNIGNFNADFVRSVSELQSDFGGPTTVRNSVAAMEGRVCSNLTMTTSSPGVVTAAPSPSSTPSPPKKPDSTGDIDANHALRLVFTVDSRLLYGGRIGDYLVASGLNAALRRAGLRDIEDVDITNRDCLAGDSCRITAIVLCRNHSSSSSSSSNASSTGDMHSVSLSTLTASLSGDQLLRPADLLADIVPALPPQQIPASSVIYRYAASPYFNRPPPSIGSSSTPSILPVRVSILWRLVSVNTSAPLAYRSLPSDPPASGSHRLRFLLEQMLVDLLGSRLLSWPVVAMYKSDANHGRLDAFAALEGGSLDALSAETSARADGFPLASFVRLSDLRVQKLVQQGAAATGRKFDGALMLQSYSLRNFVSNATLQSMPDSDIHRLLYGKLHFVQSAIFSGQGGRPSLLSFEYVARRQLDASIRIDALSRVSWPSANSAFDETSLSRLINSELEALQANMNVFPMAFDSRRSTLQILDSRRGMPARHWCDLLLHFRPTAADIAVATADASWIPVADRLSARLVAGNVSHVTVLSLPANPTGIIVALASISLTEPTRCSDLATQLLNASTNSDKRLVAARSVSDNVLAFSSGGRGSSSTSAANLSVLVRHSALLPAHHPLRVSDGDFDSVGEYFCFLSTWAHQLFNTNSSSGSSRGGVCVSNLVEKHQIRLNPLSNVSSTALRLSTVSAFTDTPPDQVMRLFWLLKNFFLLSNETFIDLDRMRLHLNASGMSDDNAYASLIISQLPSAPTHSVINVTTTAATTPATQPTWSVSTESATSKTTVIRQNPTTPAPTVTSLAQTLPAQTPASGTTTITTTTTTTTTTATPTPSPTTPRPPVGPYYTAVDRMAVVSINLTSPSDPWLARYFYSAKQPNQTVARALSDYLLLSALKQSLQRSGWQVAADEISDIRVQFDTGRDVIQLSVDLLLPDNRNVAELESIVRTGMDQSMLISTTFSKRTFSSTVVSLPARRYLHRPPTLGSTQSQNAPRLSVDQTLLIRLSDEAPNYLRLRAAGGESETREDLLLNFLVQQLVVDACGTDWLVGRPQLVRYKADSQLAVLQLRYSISQRLSGNSSSSNVQQFSSEFAAAWQRLEPAVSVHRILYLDTRQGPPPPHRGLLLYQMLRLESYINKKSLMSLPSDYLALLLRPKIEYVMQQVFPGGDTSVPQYLDVDTSFTKKDGALEIIALTRVAIPPGFRLAKLQQRLQLHVMQRLEQLANDINLVPSVFSVGRTDIRVVDLKEGLSEQYWCDLVYSFTMDGGTALTALQGFELGTYLSQLLAGKLPQHVHLERLAVLQFGLSPGSAHQLEVQALVTLSSARSLPFDTAAGILMKASAAVGPSSTVRLVTRAVAAPFRISSTAAGLGPGSSARYRQVNQVVTFLGDGSAAQPGSADKLAKYACHLYQSSLESAHWSALYVVPHSCSAAIAAYDVRVTISQQPSLWLSGLRLNVSAMVASQSDTSDVASTASRAFVNALIVKNFYFKSDEVVLAEDVAVWDFSINIQKRPTDAPSMTTPTMTAQSTATQLTTAPPVTTKATPPPAGLVNSSSETITETTRPPVVLRYRVKLQFPLTNATWDYLSEPDTPMALLLAQSLLDESLSANSTVLALARYLVVTNASRDLDAALSNATESPLGFGQVLASFAPPSAVASADYLRLAVTRAVSTWPMAARLFTGRPSVTVWPEFEIFLPTTPAPTQGNGTSNATTTAAPQTTPSKSKTGSSRRRRSVSGATSAEFVEHRLQLFGSPSLPVYYRYRDISTRADPLLTYLTERLLKFAMQRFLETSGRRIGSGMSNDWPKLAWLRSDNTSVTMAIRYPVPSGLSDRDTMDGFASAWVDVSRNLTGCSLCMARHQELRRVASVDSASETVGLLTYQRLQFDGFVGSNTMRKLDHDDLNQLMRHRLQFILERLYPGGANKASSLTLAGFDFECYGRNSTVVTFLLVRLLARADVLEADIRRHVTEQLRQLATNEHVLPAQLSNNGSDLRLLAKRSGLPSKVTDWFDIQATFEYAEVDGTGEDSLHGYALAAGARRHLDGLLGTSTNQSLSIVQLRLMRWKRLGASVRGRHRQLVTVLATMASTGQPNPAATPRELRDRLANWTGLSGPNLTLPLQDFDHEPGHHRHHLQLMHSGVAVHQTLYLVDSGSELLTSDFLCLLIASAFRQRGSGRLRFIDDSCAARITSRSLLTPHPLSARRIPAMEAAAYFTLHNSSQPFNPDEATDVIGQLVGSLNAYADIGGRMVAAGDVAPIQAVPIYQLLQFTSAGFPDDLRNTSSPLYIDTSNEIKRTLAVYLRQVANLFSGQVTNVRFQSGSILVMVNYLIYPRLLSASLAASEIERSTEAAFASNSPFHGLQLDKEASFVSAAPIADKRQPQLDTTAHQSTPIAIYCILGVACFLLMLLSALLLVRLIRMRRSNTSSRLRPQPSTGSSHRRSLLGEKDAEKGRETTAAATTAGGQPVARRIDLEDGQPEQPPPRSSSSSRDPTRLPSTEVPQPPAPLLPQPPENPRRASSSSRRMSSANAAAQPATNSEARSAMV